MFANFSSIPMCAHFNVFTMISFWLRLHIVLVFFVFFLHLVSGTRAGFVIANFQF